MRFEVVDPERAKLSNEKFDRMWHKQNPPRAVKPERITCMWYFVPEHWKKIIHGSRKT